MKYILLPLLKILWTVFITILLIPLITTGTILILLCYICIYIWTFDRKYLSITEFKDLFSYTIKCNETDLMSIYHKDSNGSTEYKTIFHYFWGINPIIK